MTCFFYHEVRPSNLLTLVLKSLLCRKSTLAQFSGPQQMFETWLSDTTKLSLSAYGTRRLFDALKKGVWAPNKKSLETGAYLKTSGPPGMQQRCARCTRFHPGGPDTCKSKSMVSKFADSLFHVGESWSQENERVLKAGMKFICQICLIPHSLR